MKEFIIKSRKDRGQNKALVLAIALVSLLSCKEEVKKTIVEVKQDISDNTIKFELPGKRGMIKHQKNGALNPFENAYLPVPKGYSGPTFSLSHDYPINGSVSVPKTYPWKKVTNNSIITKANSLAYVEALKKYVSPDMEKLLYNYDQWDAAKEPWYQSIWLGQVREPIHGLYVGSPFGPGTLGKTQTEGLTTYVLTLYDKTAAQTLNNIWGTDKHNAYNPNLQSAALTQYAEGSVIVKFAFVNYPNNDWVELDGAATWPAYTDVKAGHQTPQGASAATIRDLKLMQFDIIVKDSQAAPETGWVFSTLVYDKNAKGNTAWDKMIPLGATWGNDPDIVAKLSKKEALAQAVVPAPVDTSLTQNWINPKAPSYAVQTLGWGGRLSGPNDGAVFATGPVTTSTSGHKFTPNGVSTVGCLGCHSTAQYKFNSFLVPIVFPTPSGNGTPLVFDPGSDMWNRYFRSNDGKTPFDLGQGQIGLDYDMVTAFKAIPAWQKAKVLKKD